MAEEIKLHCDLCSCRGFTLKPGLKKAQHLQDFIKCDVCNGEVDRNVCDVCEIEAQMIEDELRAGESQ